MSVVRLQGESEKRRGIHYELESSAQPIGVGGMGQVFQGLCVNERTGTRRDVAIKFMFDDLPPQAIERARREASIQLHNDNLIEMLGFIETIEKTPIGDTVRHYHVVSELLTGVSLYDLLKGKTTDRHGQENPYAAHLLHEFRTAPELFAKKIVASVLSGLMALHDAGFIHRDIDPSNIMVTNDGRIKLIDLGLAKYLVPHNDSVLSLEGKFMGKPECAAPELVMGDIQHQNQSTDIYSVGVLLYQCLTGHTPFQGARHEIMEQQLHAKIDLSPIENKALRAVIAKATEKKQALRYQTCYEMRVALDGGSGTKEKTNKFLITILVGALFVLGVIAFFMLNGRSAPSGGSDNDTTMTPDTQVVAPVPFEKDTVTPDTDSKPQSTTSEEKKEDAEEKSKGTKQKKDKVEKDPQPTPVVKSNDYTHMSDSQLEQLSETDDKAQSELGRRLVRRGGSNNIIRAIQLFKKAISQGNAQARTALAQVMGALEQKAANGDAKSMEILESMNH